MASEEFIIMLNKMHEDHVRFENIKNARDKRLKNKKKIVYAPKKLKPHVKHYNASTGITVLSDGRMIVPRGSNVRLQETKLGRNLFHKIIWTFAYILRSFNLCQK